MLKNYELVNVPDGGVDHSVDGRRWSITDQLTDSEADYLINAGLTKYFRLKPQDNVNQPDPTQAGEGTQAGQGSQGKTEGNQRNRGTNGRFAGAGNQSA